MEQEKNIILPEIKIPIDTHRQLDRMAESRQQSTSVLVAQILEKFVRKQEKRSALEQARSKRQGSWGE